MKTDTLPALTGNNGQIADLTRERLPMSEFEQEPHHSGLNLNDILFILFRHKWKIFLCTLTGIVAAAVVYFILPSVYESEAKLFVRYVVDRSAIDALDTQVKTPGTQNENLISSEVEILTSEDLAIQVAEAIGIN